MSKSHALIMCHKKPKKSLLANVFHSNIENKYEQIMVVLKTNCNSEEIRIQRPECFPRFRRRKKKTSKQMCDQLCGDKCVDRVLSEPR